MLTLFYTLSMADMSWPDLHRLMPEDPFQPGLTDADSFQIRMWNVTKNPHIVAAYLSTRHQHLRETILQHLDIAGDAPWARQHARIRAEEQLRAQSPMRRGAGPTGWWRGDARDSATSATQPIQLPTHSDRSPPPTARIGPKLGRNIEHWWYDGSPANRSTAIPQSPAISQHIY